MERPTFHVCKTTDLPGKTIASVRMTNQSLLLRLADGSLVYYTVIVDVRGFEWLRERDVNALPATALYSLGLITEAERSAICHEGPASVAVERQERQMLAELLAKYGTP